MRTQKDADGRTVVRESQKTETDKKNDRTTGVSLRGHAVLARTACDSLFLPLPVPFFGGISQTRNPTFPDKGAGEKRCVKAVGKKRSGTKEGQGQQGGPKCNRKYSAASWHLDGEGEEDVGCEEKERASAACDVGSLLPSSI